MCRRPGPKRLRRHARHEPLPGKPGIALRIRVLVVGVEIDEAPLDLEVPNLEHIAPASGVRRPA